jgi:chlorobactene glucosyltransferase
VPVQCCIVVPARDEERNIGPCLDGLLAQQGIDVSIIVVDDGSTDRTGEVLERYAGSIEVLDGGDEALPEDWLGKPWACQRGGQRALELFEGERGRTQWILFVDADVRLEPRALWASIGYAHEKKLGLLSGLGRLTMQGFWEKVLQPAVGGLIIAGNDLEKTNEPGKAKDRVLANGQFLLFERSCYESIGCHESVRVDVLDDVGLASTVVAAGGLYHLLFMRTLFSCRMYEGLGEIWEGWSKNLFAGLEFSWKNLLTVCAGLLTFTILPYLVLLWALCTGDGGAWLFWGVGLVTLIQLVRLYLDHLFGHELAYSLTHLLGMVLLVGLLANSALRSSRGTTTWKGRTLPRGTGTL